MDWSLREAEAAGAEATKLALWWAPLDVDAATLAALAGDVPEAERHRAEQQRFARDRDRQIVLQACLRRLLAGAIGGAPAEVPIVVAPGGKPGLADSALRFSQARSAGVALWGLSRTTEVGVDLEAIRRDTDMDGVAARFFSPAERRALAALAPEERTAAAYGCWARKEAYAKVTGTGLTFRLADAEVGIGGAGPAHVGGWTVHDVTWDAGFAAAVAGDWPAGWVPGPPRRFPVESQPDRE